MGYTDRPINQRTQVMNTYLDGSTYDAQKSIASTESEFLVDSATYTNIWTYNFVWNTAEKWFLIPTDWTYTITLTSIVWWFVTPTSWMVVIYIESEYYDSKPVVIPREACDWDGNSWATTAKFYKWEYVKFFAKNTTDQTLTVRVIATITKIS